MPKRELFDPGDILHVYNRGVDKRVTFEESWDYMRFANILSFCNNFDYPFSSYEDRLRQVQSAEAKERVDQFIKAMYRYDQPLCNIIAWVLMPNHFHLILLETQERGISRFMQKIGNSYTKYFNAKNDRSGSLFQGTFKHVKVESEEQLFHLSRYVHVNPTAAGLVSIFDLKDYPWSSLPEYLSGGKEKDEQSLCESKDLILSHFQSRQSYFNYVTAEFRADEAAANLEGLTLDDDFGWYDST